MLFIWFWRLYFYHIQNKCALTTTLTIMVVTSKRYATMTSLYNKFVWPPITLPNCNKGWVPFQQIAKPYHVKCWHGHVMREAMPNTPNAQACQYTLKQWSNGNSNSCKLTQAIIHWFNAIHRPGSTVHTAVDETVKYALRIIHTDWRSCAILTVCTVIMSKKRIAL